MTPFVHILSPPSIQAAMTCWQEEEDTSEPGSREGQSVSYQHMGLWKGIPGACCRVPGAMEAESRLQLGRAQFTDVCSASN